MAVEITTLLTSTCFTSRQYGVLIVMHHMLETSVSTPTTGKTSEESLISLNMIESNALSGRPSISSKPTQTVVKMNTDADSLMDGRSKSITL